MKTVSNNFAPGISRIFGWMVLIAEILQFTEILTTFSWKILYHLPLCPNFRKFWLNGKRPRWKGRFHPRDPHPCKFIGTKQSVYTRKEFNSWTPTWLQFHQMATATSGENGLLWKTCAEELFTLVLAILCDLYSDLDSSTAEHWR